MSDVLPTRDLDGKERGRSPSEEDRVPGRGDTPQFAQSDSPHELLEAIDGSLNGDTELTSSGAEARALPRLQGTPRRGRRLVKKPDTPSVARSGPPKRSTFGFGSRSLKSSRFSFFAATKAPPRNGAT